MRNTALAFAALAASAHLCMGAQTVTLATKSATATIDTLGARVVSLRLGGGEVLWNPRVPGVPGKSWNHGGLPVCWPWFGTSGGHTIETMHGFAKDFRFEVVSTSSGETRSTAVLKLVSDERTRRIWPHDFDLTFEATLTDTLRLSLRSANTGDAPFRFSGGFHPYFLIGDRDRAYVTGMDGLDFCDARVTETLGDKWRGDMRLLSSFDHVFKEPRSYSAHSLVDKATGRVIDITASGVSQLVVWNPGVEEKAPENPGPGMFGAGEWRRFVCVEPAFLWDDGEVVLQPGGRHQFDMEISARTLKKD